MGSLKTCTVTDFGDDVNVFCISSKDNVSNRVKIY